MSSTKHQLEYSFPCSAIQLHGQLADQAVLVPVGINRRLAGMTDATTLQTVTASLFLSWLYEGWVFGFFFFFHQGDHNLRLPQLKDCSSLQH